jgi:hypothetical protein
MKSKSTLWVWLAFFSALLTIGYVAVPARVLFGMPRRSGAWAKNLASRSAMIGP